MLVVIGIFILVISFIVALVSLVAEERKRDKLIYEPKKGAEPPRKKEEQNRPSQKQEPIGAGGDLSGVDKNIEERAQFPWEQDDPAKHSELVQQKQKEPFPWENEEEPEKTGVLINEPDKVSPEPGLRLPAESGPPIEEAPDEISPVEARFPHLGADQPLSGSFKIGDISKKSK